MSRIIRGETNNDNNFPLQSGTDKLDARLGVSKEESSRQGKLLREPFDFKTTCAIFVTDRHAQIQHAEKSQKRNETKWQTGKC